METKKAFTRINGEMLHNYRGSNVCMLGKLIKVANDSMSFEIEACDGKSPVLVKLKSPLRDNLSDYVEVYGSVDERGNILCLNYATFDPSMTQNFDLGQYNEAVVMSHKLTKHYMQEQTI